MFANQVPLLTLSYEQAKCLASGVRTDVFWTFSGTEPISVREVAHRLGKSAQTIHYHVAELLKQDLLVPAMERQVHSRIEVLYVRKGLKIFSQTTGASREYNALRIKSFRLTMTTLIRETEYFFKAVEEDQSRFDHSTFLRKTVRMTPEQAVRFRERMMAVLDEISAEQVAEGGTRTDVVLYARPTVDQSRAWLGELDEETDEGEDLSS